METENSPLIVGYPSVYAVEDEYQICVLVASECTMWVEVDGVCYYDHSNGILRSGRFVHIAHVPLKALDKAKKYTVHLQRMIERKAYFANYGEVQSQEYLFRPVKAKSKLRIINLPDAHCLVKAPIKCGSHFGDKLDLLVLNGDIPNHSGDINYFKAIYEISGGITKGEVPCIFSRGNHDMRGTYAEELEGYTPTNAGKSYFTFHLGPIWGIVMDSGEDKVDTCDEYGRTVCCSAFRREQEEFLDKVIKDGAYKKAKTRLIVSHHPFAFKPHAPFDIEQELYRRWCKKLKKLNADLWLSGHLHTCFFEKPGEAHDSYGYPCPVLCSSRTNYGKENVEKYTLGAVTISNYKDIKVEFVSAEIKSE